MQRANKRHTLSHIIIGAIAGVLMISVTIYAAGRTIDEGRASGQRQQTLLANQIADEIHDLLGRTESTLAGIDLSQLPANHEAASVWLHSQVEQRVLDSWAGAQVVDGKGVIVAESGAIEHTHEGEGYVACERCRGDHMLIVRSTQGPYEVEAHLSLESLRERFFQPVENLAFQGSIELQDADGVMVALGAVHTEDDIQSDITVHGQPTLQLVVREPANVLTAGIRDAVLMQLLATGAFLTMLLLYFSLVWQRAGGAASLLRIEGRSPRHEGTIPL